jgi:hypothetical protein
MSKPENSRNWNSKISEAQTRQAPTYRCKFAVDILDQEGAELRKYLKCVGYGSWRKMHVPQRHLTGVSRWL